MAKKILMNLAVALALLLSSGLNVALAAPLAQEESAYTVKLGDNLWTLAEKYLGSGPAYWAIVSATNERAQEDTTFASIADPNLIHPGWKLLIPSVEEAARLMEQCRAGPATEIGPSGEKALEEMKAELLSSGYTLETREFTQEGAVYRALIYTHVDWHLHPSHLLISKSQDGQTSTITHLQEERKIGLVSHTPQGEQRLDWVDMNADGLMEFPYMVYQGGNCWTCLQMQVLQVGAADRVVNLTELVPSEDSLGDEFALGGLIDVDDDGVLEWQVGDTRFEFAFDLCHACSPRAVRLYAWDGKTYRNASAQFPDYYQHQIEELTAQVEKIVQGEEPWTGYEVGPMVSLLLAYENAGRFEEGWEIFERISDPSQYAGRASEEQLQSLREAREFFAHRQR